jgi:cold shock CspA family protein
VGQVEKALPVLQESARLQRGPQVLIAIARAQFDVSEYLAATDICSDLLASRMPASFMRMTVRLGLRSAVFGAEQLRWNGDLSGAINLLESAAQLSSAASVQDIEVDAADWLVRLKSIADALHTELEGDAYLSGRCRDVSGRLLDRVRVIDPQALNRQAGQVRMIERTKHFAFAESETQSFFFHHNDLVNREDWDLLDDSVLVCFTAAKTAQGPRARQVRVL